MTKKNTLEDFWRFVDKGDLDECWEWKGCRKNLRYGLFKYSGKKHPAHRISYQLHYGRIEPGMYILHKCDNGFCVNPNHLMMGTQKDNMRDMFEKGRANPPRGDRTNTAKLTWEQVREIRRRYIPFKVSTIKLGKEYGVTNENIGYIVRGVTWKE